MEFIYFSFLQGVLAFLAPCAVALLPGYIMVFISRSNDKSSLLSSRLMRGLKLALFSILGILLVYSLAGGAILLASQILKQYMKWITMVMGFILLWLGVLMILGKNISLSLHLNNAKGNTEATEAFLFGTAYAIGALGCLFPLFLVVATQAMAAPTIWLGSSYILAYFAGMSGMMFLTIILSVFARDILMKNLRIILPYMERIAGFMLIIAGIYVIQYQMALF